MRYAHSKTRAVDRVERERLAVELRVRGATFEQIAAGIRQEHDRRLAIGEHGLIRERNGAYSKSQAHADVRRALQRHLDALSLSSEALREILKQRAEARYRIAWDLVSTTRDPKVKLMALDRCADAEERLATLEGIDKGQAPVAPSRKIIVEFVQDWRGDAAALPAAPQVSSDIDGEGQGPN